MNILFTIDRGYLEHMEDCIRSFLRFPVAEGYDIYIMHSDLRAEDEARLRECLSGSARLHFVFVNLEKELEFPESSRYPIQIYYRIFASMLLPADLERILYLDADTLVINPLEELYQMEFDGKYILACTHIRRVLNKINRVRLGIREERPYINSGVMLMNLEELRKKQDFREVVNFVEEHKNVMTLPDQDIITGLYGDRIGLLDTMIYNLSDRMLVIYNTDLSHKKRDLQWVREHAVVIHYYGKRKPWKKNYVGILDVFYKELKEETGRMKALVKQNRSYRRFYQNAPIPAGELRDWVDNARYCPSGGNLQALRFRIVTEPGECEKVFAALHWAAALPEWDGPAEGERPSAYIVIVHDLQISRERKWDAGIAAQTIMLSAVERGYGGCILGSVERKKLSAELGIDAQQYETDLVLALGKPKEQVEIVPVGEDGSTAYYRDEAQVHYVPKRSLAEILL